MQIDEIRTKNFKGLKEVTIRAAGRRVILIGGKNGAGKSSLLDSIIAALGGAKNVPAEPIRRGEDDGFVEIEVGDFRVVRTFRGDGKTSLKVTAKDGGKYGQARLDQIFSTLGPDPVAFLNAKPVDQVEIAKGALGLDLSSFDQARSEAFAARTDVNRDAARLKGELAGLSFHEDAPEAEESATAILAEIKAASDHNESGRRLRERSDAAQASLKAKTLAIANIKEQIRELEAKLKAAEDDEAHAVMEARDARCARDEFIEADIAPIQARLDAIESTNRLVRENQKRAAVAAQLKAKERESEDLTKTIEKIDQDRAATIKAAKFPVEGLEIGSDGLLLNGLPFAQSSSAQRLRVAVAMGLAMNPELRVFLVRDGSLLDDDTLALFCQMAEEHDAQFWIERVGSRDDEAIIIEDGEIKAVATT